MVVNGYYRNRQGFALPSILIASVVILAVLVVAMQSVATTRTALESQYYNRLAQAAAESGIAMASACLDQNGLTVTWSDSKPLQPNTDCEGNILVSCPTATRDERCGVEDNDLMRTSFVVGSPVSEAGASRTITVAGKVERFRRSNGNVWQSYDYRVDQLAVRQLDLSATRASHRWWFFGTGAGLDFGTSGTTVTPVNAPCTSTCTAFEGITVASDKQGSLLFWTNGMTIWNRDGNPILNGGGLVGGNSTAQAATFLPLGTDGKRYAVVTNSSVAGSNPPGALFYSVIDMAGDGGKGAVVGTKNMPLWPGQSSYSSEALNVAPKADGTGYWVMTWRTGSTNLIVFEFDKNGLVPGSAREFSAGVAMSKTGLATAWGTINFNTDYSKIVLMAGFHCLGSSACPRSVGAVRVMDFNTQTGEPTNQFAWDNGYSLSQSGTDGSGNVLRNEGYAADFSTNGDYVYTTVLYPARLYRYKIAGASTSADVKASEEGIGYINSPSTPNVFLGGGQVRRAPDGKVYVANRNSTAISVINYPDAATTSGMTMAQRQAAIGFVYNGRSLTPGKTSIYGLPQMMVHYTPRRMFY